MAKKKTKAKAKVRTIRVQKVETLADQDKHVIVLEAEVQGPLPELPPDFSEARPLDLFPEAPEPAKQSWWEFLKSW